MSSSNSQLTPIELKTIIKDAFREVIAENETPKQGSDLRTRERVLEELGITAPTLADWTRRGIIPSYRIGGRVYYKQSEIDAALTRRNFGKEVGA
jgi:predicted DNA-binding transcriptional regulator AlpA